MTINLQVTNYEKKNALLPTLEVSIRVKYQDSYKAYVSTVFCEVYFGTNEANFFKNAVFLTSTSIAVSHTVQPSTDFDFDFNLTFTQEMLYRLDKFIASQDDAHFIIYVRMPVHYFEVASNVNPIGFQHASCKLVVKMSDWVRIATDWGREMVLVPMSPKTNERIKEVMRNSRYLRSIDEVFTELLNRYEKEELQKQGE